MTSAFVIGAPTRWSPTFPNSVLLSILMSSTTRPYQNRLREEQAAATRERIIDALAELAVEGHLLDVPIRDVAARAGVSDQRVYRLFVPRDGLLEARPPRQFRQIAEGIEPTSVEDLARAVSTIF